MSYYEITPRVVFLSILYFLLAAVILVLLDIGLLYFFDYLVFPALNWFNAQSLAWKILLLLICSMVFIAFLQVVSRIFTLIGGLVFNLLPQNQFTVYGSMALAFANTIFCLYHLWTHPERYTGWVVIELIILSTFIWSLMYIVFPTKEQMRIFEKEDRKYNR